VCQSILQSAAFFSFLLCIDQSATCRRRTTPYSVRFLGRRVYLGVVVTLACALSAGLSLQRAGALTAHLHVPLRTLQRWRRWWLVDFVQAPFWQAKRAFSVARTDQINLAVW